MKWLAMGLLALCACRGSGPVIEWEQADTAAWTAVDAGGLVNARIALEGGDLAYARALVLDALAAQPSLLSAHIMLQEIELAEPESDPEALAAEARQRASELGSGYLESLLAARLEPDPVAARLLLEAALATEMPGDFEAACRYGLAYVAYQQGDMETTENQLATSLKLDPGGLRARRLEAYMAHQGSDHLRAAALLGHWIEAAELAPEVSSDVWYAAMVEWTALNVELGERSEASTGFALFGMGRGAGRFGPASAGLTADALLVVAALSAETGDPEVALSQVQSSMMMSAGNSRRGRLAMVDEALLYELFLGRDLDAIAAWEAVLKRFEEAGAEVDFDELLRAMEARTRLARLRARQPK